MVVRPQHAAVVGAVVLMSAAAATGAAGWSVRRVVKYTDRFGWDTIPALWPLLAGVGVAGLVLLVRPHHGRRAAVVAAVCASQLVGGGVAASRDWFNIGGATGLPTRHLAVVLPLTAVLIVAMTVACCAAVSLLMPAVAGSRPRWGWLITGATIAVLAPILWVGVVDSWQVTALGQAALTWSLPWGLAIAAAGWLADGPRRAAAAAVAASTLVTAGAFAIIALLDA
ncbi:hypothetical protein B0I29_10157 [Actinoplanes lutulentus]|uniref:Uncharacterized protein n=1 Tax=Actinoplanes lutulentus TaxID=1287878 RepID=A0A327ZIY1_9ACTN|nr:hypothetical protein B0I29_10157 [Actinoplanes lutulentus]